MSNFLFFFSPLELQSSKPLTTKILLLSLVHAVFPAQGHLQKEAVPLQTDLSLHKYSGYGKVFIPFSTTCHVDFIMNQLLSSGKQMETSADSPCQRKRQEEGEKNCWI